MTFFMVLNSGMTWRTMDAQDDFNLSDEKIGDYYTAARRVLTNIFGKRTVMAFVTSPEKAATYGNQAGRKGNVPCFYSIPGHRASHLQSSARSYS